MNADKSKVKRWRRRLTVGALIAATIIVCAYFGLSQVTKHWGVAEIENYLARQQIDFDSDSISVRAPFVIEATTYSVLIGSDPLDVYINSKVAEQNYYVWFFGTVNEF
jgi:hypothetical protein